MQVEVSEKIWLMRHRQERWFTCHLRRRRASAGCQLESVTCGRAAMATYALVVICPCSPNPLHHTSEDCTCITCISPDGMTVLLQGTWDTNVLCNKSAQHHGSECSAAHAASTLHVHQPSCRLRGLPTGLHVPGLEYEQQCHLHMQTKS